MCQLIERISCVFFCKQKTAYEMRISDWSSDVCSSDLDGAKNMRVSNVPRGACRPRCTSYDGLKASQEILRLNLRKSHVETTGMPLHRGRRYDHVRDKIGSASCRERVCQYV